MPRSPDAAARPHAHRVFGAFLAATLLVQLGWILVLPAFAGIDEFDHVFKADAVSHGQLGDSGTPADGRGGLVGVSDDVVTAASSLCASYSYTGRDDCHPVGRLPGDRVTVASGAASYNPTYYAVVGLLARPFTGAATDFAMRGIGALIAALLLAWAAVVTSGWSRNRWPLVCLGLATTPVLLYSSAIASPNGIGYAAAALLWAAGLGLVAAPHRPRFAAVAVAAAVMMTTHTTGVIWLALILAVLATLQPIASWRALRRERGRPLGATLAALGAVGAACVAWILLAGTNALNPVDEALPPLRATAVLRSLVLWSFQTIAAFPLRDQPAPLGVYVLWLVPFVVVLVMAWRHASPRVRVAFVLLLAAWVSVPVALTVVSYASEGFAWQGRYALPLALGFPALAALALNRGRGIPALPAGLAFATYAAAHTVSVGFVAARYGTSPHAPTLAAGIPGGFALATVLVLVGSLVPVLLLRRPAATRAAAPTPDPAAAPTPDQTGAPTAEQTLESAR